MCKAVEQCGMSRGQLYRTLDSDATLADRYTRAKERQIEYEISQIIEIADTPMIGEKEKILPNGEVEVTRGDMIEHRKMMIDARKWTASKLIAKKYGEKVDLTTQGEKITTVDPLEAVARIKAILEKK